MLPNDRLQVAAMVAARVTVGTVDSPAVPGEPLSWVCIHVLAVPEVEQLALECRLGVGIRPDSANLTPEDHAYGHSRNLGGAPARGNKKP